MPAEKSVFFVDYKYPKSYTYDDLLQKPMGGTESTALRVAHALQQRGYQCHMFQGGREGQLDGLTDETGLTYHSIETLGVQRNPGAVVLLRERKKVKGTNALFPRAKKVLWLHDVVKRPSHYPWWQLRKWTIACVSRFQANQFHDDRVPLIYSQIKRADIQVLHNPLCIDTAIDPICPDNPNEIKLVFFSSRSKGLSQTLEFFEKIYEKNPNFRLYLGNPGYCKFTEKEKTLSDHPGITVLGALPRDEVLRHVAGAMCVLYPQTNKPETFGLVYAEANALGTPVLCADIGAASEVLSSTDQIVIPPTTDAFIKTISQWADKRPIIEPTNRFNIEGIADKWESVLQLV